MDVSKRLAMGTGLAIAASAGYATFPILVKYAYQAGVQSLEMAVWRFILAAAVTWLMWPVWRRRARLGSFDIRKISMLLGLGGLMGAVSYIALLSLARVDVSTYTVILYTYPVIVAVLSFMLGERLPLIGWAAIVLAVTGCALAVNGQVSLTDWSGVLFTLANATSYAIYLVIAQRLTQNLPHIGVGVIVLAGAGLAVLVIGFGVGVEPLSSTRAWLIMLALSVVSTVLPLTLMLAAINWVGASRAAVLSTIEPVMTLILAVLVLGEVITPLQLLGASLILLSVVGINLRDSVQVDQIEPTP